MNPLKNKSRFLLEAGLFYLKNFGFDGTQTYLCAPELRIVCRVRLRARTPPFHGGDTGSNPVRGTKNLECILAFQVFLFWKSLSQRLILSVFPTSRQLFFFAPWRETPKKECPVNAGHEIETKTNETLFFQDLYSHFQNLHPEHERKKQ